MTSTRLTSLVTSVSSQPKLMERSFWLAPISSASTSFRSTPFAVSKLSAPRRCARGEEGNDTLRCSSVMQSRGFKKFEECCCRYKRGEWGSWVPKVVKVPCAWEFLNKPIPGWSSNWSSSPAEIPPTELFLSGNESCWSSTGFVSVGRTALWLLRIICGESGRVVHASVDVAGC